MKNFFWTSFGIFFILASTIGLIVTCYNLFDWIASRKRIKKIQKEQLGKKQNFEKKD